MSSKKNNLPDKILIVDDDPSDISLLQKILAPQQIKVVTAKDWSTALYQYNQHRIDLAIVELELTEMSGSVMISKWRNHEMEGKRNAGFVITTTKNRTNENLSLIKEMGDISILTKPFKVGEVLNALSKAMAMKAQREKFIEVEEKFIKPFMRQGKLDKAKVIAEEKLMHLGPRGQLLASSVFEQTGDLEKALVVITGLAKEDPSNMRYLNEMARLYMLMGRVDEAQKCYEKADKIAPDNLNRLHDMATMYMQQQEPNQAIEKYKKILKLSPEDTDSKYNMYQKLLNAGFEKHAQQFCSETSTPMELIRHFNNKGVVYSKKDDYTSAIDEYKKAMRLIPGSKHVYKIMYNMAIAHINLKNYDHIAKANEILKEVLELAPDFEKAQDKLKLTEGYLRKASA